jgi:hypothetical protein
MQSYEPMREATGPAENRADEIPLTRREAAAFLTSKGFRMSHSTLTKLCSPAIGEGPESCGKFGRDRMYYPSVLLDWARKRMSGVHKDA